MRPVAGFAADDVIGRGDRDLEHVPERLVVGALLEIVVAAGAVRPPTDHDHVQSEVTSARLGAPFTARRWRTGYETADNLPTLICGPDGQMYLAHQNVYGPLTLRAPLPGGVLAAPVRLTPGDVFAPRVAVDAAGRGIATWDSGFLRSKHHAVQARSFTLQR